MAGHEFRRCFAPFSQAHSDAIAYLTDAARAHRTGDRAGAAASIKKADIGELHARFQSIMGPWAEIHRRRDLPNRSALKEAHKPFLDAKRNYSDQHKLEIFDRDGFHCRFCEVPIIPTQVWKVFRANYPNEIREGRAPDGWNGTKSNSLTHFAYQALLGNVDHVLPHCFGG